MFMFNFKILVLLAVFIGFSPNQLSAQQPIVAPVTKAAPNLESSLTIKKQNGEELSFSIELALTPQEQAKGLMFRTELAENEGMLFVFRNEAPRSFWMKNTLIPLDIIFIKQNGEILNIGANAIPQDLTPVRSEGNAYAVLEINGGLSKKLGIKPGDRIMHPVFSSVVLK